MAELMGFIFVQDPFPSLLIEVKDRDLDLRGDWKAGILDAVLDATLDLTTFVSSTYIRSYRYIIIDGTTSSKPFNLNFSASSLPWGHSITTWTRWGEEGVKKCLFFPCSGYKNCPRRGRVKKWQNSVHVVVEWPLTSLLSDIFRNLNTV